MARIRSIKPGFFLNEAVGTLPFKWRLLFVGLWTQADREGRLEDRPMRLKAALFPYDDLDVNEGLGCLVNAGLITRYERDGLQLIAIPTWGKHQQPYAREVPSELPAPPEYDLGNAQAPPSQCSSTSVLGADPDPVLGADQEGSRSGVHALRARFERFWTAYPRKVGKDAAWREWLKRSPSDDLTDQMITAADAQRASAQWCKDGGQFIPHPRTWLHQGRWNDEPATASVSLVSERTQRNAAGLPEAKRLVTEGKFGIR